jgi:predicted dinucleotide-binding enzyme
MKTVRTIAVIGAGGKTGAAIVRALASHQHRLLLMADEPGEVNLLKRDLERQSTAAELCVMECEREASWEADIIVVATPRSTQKRIAEKIREVATGKVVIAAFIPEASETNNGSLRCAAEELQILLPYSRVVMTANSAFAGDANSRELFIAGNTGDAINVVTELVSATGLEAVIVGDLTAGRTLEKTCLRHRTP